MHRVSRSVVMRLLVGSKRYRCPKCHQDYLKTLFGMLIGLGLLR